MASNRDLVEAQAFNRRRLVAAFLSGAPDGHVVEPFRQGRAVVGGLALAVLLLAGAAIAGFLRPPTPADWLSPGLVLSRESGTPYVILNEGDAPQRLVNVTSAMLLLGVGFETRTVAQDEISRHADGRSIGIFGAPDDPPDESDLVDSGWTACTASGGGLHLQIDDAELATPVSRGAVLVSAGGNHYLVVQTGGGAKRLRLPQSSATRNNIATALRGVEDLGEVSAAWLNLLPLGQPLTEAGFPIIARGSEANYLPGFDLRIGDVVEVNGQRLLIGDGAPMPLDEFAETVYRAVVSSDDAVPSGPLGVASAPVPSSWPIDVPDTTPLDADGDGVGEACVVLDAVPGRAAVAALAIEPDDAASAAGLDGSSRVDVAPGRGALVLGADHGTRAGGQPWLVDGWGRRYPLGGPAGDTAARLGYAAHRPVTIADGWIELFTDCGPELSQTLAMGVPALRQQRTDCR